MLYLENENAHPRSARGWRIDRQIPVALIISMVIQTFAVIWWAAKIESRVETLELHDITYNIVLDRVSRVEEKVISLKETSTAIDQKLTQLIGHKR